MAAVIDAVKTPHYFQSEYGMVQKHVINNLPRTNNSVEGFHSALRNCEHSTSLNIWKLIDTPKYEEGLVPYASQNTRHNTFILARKHNVRSFSYFGTRPLSQ